MYQPDNGHTLTITYIFSQLTCTRLVKYSHGFVLLAQDVSYSMFLGEQATRTRKKK